MRRRQLLLRAAAAFVLLMYSGKTASGASHAPTDGQAVAEQGESHLPAQAPQDAQELSVGIQD
jgi:hypothetical protein